MWSAGSDPSGRLVADVPPRLDMVLRFNADPVIHRSTNPLFTAEIALGRLNDTWPRRN